MLPFNTQLKVSPGTHGWPIAAKLHYTNMAPPVRTTVVIPFYGRIPGGQRGLVAGAYTDGVVVKINY